MVPLFLIENIFYILVILTTANVLTCQFGWEIENSETSKNDPEII